MKPEERLTSLGLELPELPDPLGNYDHGVRTSGRHARAAVGMGSLPGNVTVEIDAVVEVAP